MGKYLGQHFLKNRDKIRKIAGFLKLEDWDTVVEIGPGNGSLTKEMGRKDENLRIIGVEKDPDLFRKLKENLYPEFEDKLEIMEGDILTILPKISEELGEYKLVGNIPYYITGHLLRVLGELKNKPKLTVIMIQKEVAERTAAEPPEMNILGASVQIWGEVDILDYVPKGDFRPKPKVDGAVIRIIPSGRPVPENYYPTIKRVFQHPRKTLLNNFSAGSEEDKNVISEKIKSLGIDPAARPQNLSVEDIVKLSSLK